jgi:anti-sigma factor RsiW
MIAITSWASRPRYGAKSRHRDWSVIMHLREVTLSLLSNVHPTTGAYLNCSRRVSRDKRDTIVSKRIIGTWIAVFAVIGVMLGSLAAASDGQLPYVQTNEVHTAPAWG